MKSSTFEPGLRVINAERFDRFVWPLIPIGLVLFCLEEPIHIPSVLVGLTLRPDSF